MFVEFLKFIICTGLIILISKYILVTTLRKLAENLNLKPKIVGDVAGWATSMPELLTISASAFNGLMSASIVNVLSSNIINFIQYIMSTLINKNNKAFRNKAIRIDIVLVVITILIPIVLTVLNLGIEVSIVPAFIILYFLFIFLNNNVHKLYLKSEDKLINDKIIGEEKWEKGNMTKTVIYIVYLIITAILLFFIGNMLGNTLENLCNMFGISEIFIGIILGFATSIPELITFFESQKHYKKSKVNNSILGVIESTNNLLTSNMLNLFLIQSVGILIYSFI